MVEYQSIVYETQSSVHSAARSQVAQASLNIIIKLRVTLSSDFSVCTFQVLGFQI